MASERCKSGAEPRSLQKGTRVAPLSKQERTERFNLLSEMGCCICGQPPQIHHLIGTKWRGMGQKADDRHTIPLCMKHHTGSHGIHHMGMRPWEDEYGDQEHLLNITNFKMKMLLEIQKNGHLNFDDFAQQQEQNQ
jgi:hypothetical protein